MNNQTIPLAVERKAKRQANAIIAILGNESLAACEWQMQSGTDAIRVYLVICASENSHALRLTFNSYEWFSFSRALDGTRWVRQ